MKKSRSRSPLPCRTRICAEAQRSGDRGHARWRSRSGSAARPSTTVLLPTVRAISTTDRRMTTRPCNLSRVVTQPRRCARVAWFVGPDRQTARATTFSFKGVAGLPAAGSRPLTAESRMYGGAISTTRRRSTARPCNFSRRDPARVAALRAAVLAGRDCFPTGRILGGRVLGRGTPSQSRRTAGAHRPETRAANGYGAVL